MQYIFKFNGVLLFVVGPAGVGKDTLINLLVKRFPEVVRSLSVTTRWPPRNGELDGVDYDFKSEREFCWLSATGQLAWSTFFHNNYYGTKGNELEKLWALGLIPIIDVTIEAVDYCLRVGMEPKIVFIDVPDDEERERRLRNRDPNISPKDLQTRMEKGREERQWAEDRGVPIVINENLEGAFNELCHFFNLTAPAA